MSRRINVFMLTVAVLCSISVRARADEAVNQKIVQFCQANLNKQVGDGQPASLAVAALEAAGAKPGNEGEDPQWGSPVFYRGAINGVFQSGGTGKAPPQPGDVIQLRSLVLQGTTANGQQYSKGSPLKHTMIVKKVTLPEGNKDYTFEVYEADPFNDLKVGVSTYAMNDLTSGFYRVYRADPK